MSENPKSTFSFMQEVKEYIEIERKLLKINMLEKTAKLLTFIIGIIISLVLSLVAVAYFSVLLYDLCSSLFHSPFIAVTAMIMLFLLLAFLVIRFSERLFLNFFIKKVHRILFQQDNEIINDNEKK